MKGVAGNGNVSLQALKAGNDMVLSPRNLKEEIPAVLAAVEKGELSREEIENKCRKVLTYKYVLGLKKKSYVQLSGLEQRINSPQTRDLVRRLNLAAITVLSNKNHILPLHTDKEQKIALLEVGNPGKTDVLAKQLPVIPLWPAFAFALIRQKRKTNGCVILCLPINESL